MIDLTTLKSISSLAGQYVLFPAVGGGFLYIYAKLKSWIEIKRKVKELEFDSRKALEVQSLLGELRIKCFADRAFLSMFHNGDRYIDGSSIIKLSRVSEVCGPGVSHESEKYQNLLLSIVPEVASGIIKNKTPQSTITRDLDSCRFKTMLLSQGVVKCCRAPIFKGTDLIGTVGVDFLEEGVLDADAISAINEYIPRIQEILSDKVNN